VKDEGEVALASNSLITDIFFGRQISQRQLRSASPRSKP
jgi:aspartate oxidase